MKLTHDQRVAALLCSAAFALILLGVTGSVIAALELLCFGGFTYKFVTFTFASLYAFRTGAGLCDRAAKRSMTSEDQRRWENRDFV